MGSSPYYSGKIWSYQGNGVTFEEGKDGKFFTLDGASQYLTAPDSDDWYFGSGDFTLSMWVKTNSAVGYHGMIGNFATNNEGWCIQQINIVDGKDWIRFQYSTNGHVQGIVRGNI